MKINDLERKIDTALKILAESKEGISNANEMEKGDFSREDNIVAILVERGLADRLKDTIYDLGFAKPEIPTCRITLKGIKVFKKGGWQKHLENQKVKFKRTEEKEVFDHKIAKWKMITFGQFLSLVSLEEFIVSLIFMRDFN